MSSVRRLAIPLAVVAFAGAGAGAAPAVAASGSSADIGGGATMLRLDPATATALTDNGISAAPVGEASAGAGGLTFPVTGGEIDPATLVGDVRHGGGIRFSAGSRGLTLRSFTVTVRGNGASLSARVGTVRVPVLKLDLGGATVGRHGLVRTVDGIKATLTAAAAQALNVAFDTSLFTSGLSIGTANSSIELAEAVLAGGETRLALTDAAAGALTTLGIAVAPIAPASAGSGGLAFPINTGRLDAATLAGAIGHEGGIVLSRGPRKVALQDFTISTEGSPYLSAVLGGDRVRLLNLDLAGLSVSLAGDEVVASGAVAKLTATAAKVLNRAFGTAAFVAGFPLGTATIDAELR